MAPQRHDRLPSTDEAGGIGSNSGASGTTAPGQPAAPRSLAYEDFEMLLPRGTTASSSGETGAAKFAATATGRWRSWWRRLPRGLDRIAPRSRGFERLGEEAGADQLPADHPGLGRRWCPEEEASWLSHLTFGFVSRWVVTCYKQVITASRARQCVDEHRRSLDHYCTEQALSNITCMFSQLAGK